MSLLFKHFLVLILFLYSTAGAQRIPLDFKSVNEISLVRKKENGLKVVFAYSGNEKNVIKSHEKWAKMFQMKDIQTFLLFEVTPKSYDENNKFIEDLIRHLECVGEDGVISGMLVVENDRVTLGKHVWLLRKKPKLEKKMPE
jgi:hypothetical protein